MAAKQGDTQSQYNLGEYYYNTKNPGEAIRYWFMAAEQNHADSQVFLGHMYNTYQDTVNW
jgi:TPR repeat protein